jgi:uncharacterized glyoxalase superfamily protein PhnB
MNEDRQLRQASPYFLVADVVAAAEHYRDVFGFTLSRYFGSPPSFVMASRDDVEIMLSQPVQPFVAHSNRAFGATHLDAYVRVRDVDALYRELTTRGAAVAGPPVVRPYQMREIEVTDLNGYVLCFAQDVAE